MASYGEALALEIAEGYAGPRATTFRANTLKATARDVAVVLQTQGISYEQPAFYADAFAVDETYARAIRELNLYEEGALYLQNFSAMIPPLVVNPHPQETILDMTAAPGGKTCEMAALAHDAALITACEKNPIRAQKLRYNLEKQGVRKVSVLEQDARQLDSFFSFQKVLLDAPCSGSGTIRLYSEGKEDAESGQGGEGGSEGAPRKHPATRIDFTEDLLYRSMMAQRALLRKALQVVEPGGVVVYATCSVLPEENEQTIRDALDPAFTSLALPAGVRGGSASNDASRGGRASKNGRRKGKGGASKGAQKSAMPPYIPMEVEVLPIPEELLAGVPLLPCALEGAACVKPTTHFEGFFVAALQRTR